jgi:Mg-chelatase subunit ChlI
MTRRFPLSAIVGQEPLKLALLLNAVSPQIGGVLVRGQRGTAKSTAARAVAALLPDIALVAGCACGCDPAAPDELCADCRDRVARGESLSVVNRPASFVDLPLGATEDRVAGSFDLEAALQHGARRFQPGVLAAAHRGVLYVDEVNLLDDHLVDLLLDAAAMGVNQVEREGLSFRHASRFVLVGTMNPEEGELRPQLLDRFGLCVDVTAASSIDERVTILQRCLAFERDPDTFAASWAAEEGRLAALVVAARRAVGSVAVTDADLRTIGGLVTEVHVEGHRAELVILRAAIAVAALDGRSRISDADIARVAPMALIHRLEGEPVNGPVRAVGDIATYVKAARALAEPDGDEAGKKKRSMTPAERT